MDNNGGGLLVAVEQLTVLRARIDAIHSDGNSDIGDGPGDTGGDGLNITVTALGSHESQ